MGAEEGRGWGGCCRWRTCVVARRTWPQGGDGHKCTRLQPTSSLPLACGMRPGYLTSPPPAPPDSETNPTPLLDASLLPSAHTLQLKYRQYPFQILSIPSDPMPSGLMSPHLFSEHSCLLTSLSFSLSFPCLPSLFHALVSLLPLPPPHLPLHHHDIIPEMLRWGT